MAPGFILFQGRLLGTAHLMTLAPPRPDGGKHIIEARMAGGLSYLEDYEEPDEAAGRYLELAAQLLDDPAVAAGVRAVPTVAAVPDTVDVTGPTDMTADARLAEVTPLHQRGSLL